MENQTCIYADICTLTNARADTSASAGNAYSQKAAMTVKQGRRGQGEDHYTKTDPNASRVTIEIMLCRCHIFGG